MLKFSNGRGNAKTLEFDGCELFMEFDPAGHEWAENRVYQCVAMTLTKNEKRELAKALLDSI